VRMRPQFFNPVSRRKWVEWILLIAALALVGAVFTSVHIAEVKRVDTVVRERLHVLTDIVADDIQNNLGTINRTLEGVIRDYLSGPDAVQASNDLTRRLNALQIAIPDFRSYSVADANGIITATSLPFLLGRDISSRAYFKAARAHPSMNTLYVSSPLQTSNPEPDFIVTVSRIVPGPHGEFAGLVIAALSNEFFRDSFLPVSYAPDAWGFVDHGDGQQIMNFPERKGGDGKEINQPGTFFSRHRQSGLAVSVMTGTMRNTGEQSLVVLRTIRPSALHMDKALIVGLSRKLDVIAQPLHDQAVTYGELYIGIALFCSGGLYWLQRRRAYIDALAADLERERWEANERLRINDALRESEARFRTLIEDAPLAIAMLRGGHFIYSNPRYNKLHGYLPEDDLTGLTWSAMISPESRTILHEQEALINEDSPVEQTFEVQGLRKNGRSVPVFKAVTRVDLIDGPATLIFAQDISGQKHAESAMRQARDAAEAANRSKADFLANMSHEIRSPLNAILGLAYLLEQAHLDLDAQGMVRKIRSSGRMLLGIINDILDVSKIEAGHLVVEQATFRLDDVIGNVAISMGIAAGDKDIQLIIQPLPGGISSVVGDALRLEQVLSNLTSNAIKFTQSGRVEVGVALLSQREDKVVLRFCVQDTGIDIAPELQSEVFSAFTQADSSTTRRFGGTGLGLTICRQLVGLMGGEIGVNSVSGEGSKFWNMKTHPPADDTQIDYVTHEPPSDYSVIDISCGLKIWSDAQAYQDYSRRFAESYGSAVDTISGSLAVNERPAAAALAHKLAGVAANLALPDTHRLALEAERILSTELDTTLALARLQDALTQVSAAIARYAPDTPAPVELSSPVFAIDTSPEFLVALKTLLIDLLMALDGDNLAPVKPILTKLSLALPKDALAGIRECVRNFDFRGAEAGAIRLALDQGIALKE
jgi:PAS domain S-box-containing protein